MTATLTTEIEELSNELEQLKAHLNKEREKTRDSELSLLAGEMEDLVVPSLRQRRMLKIPGAKVLSAAWLPDKRSVVCSTHDGKLVLWDAFSSKNERHIQHVCHWVSACAVSPSGKLLAAGGMDNKCTLYNLEDKDDDMVAHRRVVAGHSGFVSQCAFMYSDAQLLTASGDYSCALWDVDSGTALRRFKSHTDEVLALSTSVLDYNTFISGGCDKTARIWDVRAGCCVQVFYAHDGDINAVQFHPSGDVFATGSDDSSVKIFDLRSGNDLTIFTHPIILYPSLSIDFSVSGRLLFSGYSDYLIYLWDAVKPSAPVPIFGHENRVSCVAVSPDSASLCSGSWDGTVRIWA